MSKPVRTRYIAFILLFLSLFGYMAALSSKATAFTDAWIFSDNIAETLAFLIALLILSYFIFEKDVPRAIFFSTIFVSFIVLIPLVKHYSPIKIYTTYDSLAHYSFSKWIMEFGYVPADDELYYSNTYGFHPGNGVLPASISLVTSIPLDYAMNILLIASYVSYLAVFYITLKIINFGIEKNNNSNLNYILLIAAFSAMYFFSQYCGGSISYSMTAIISYCILKEAFSDKTGRNDSSLFLLSFIGLLLTHFSTAVIISFFLLVLVAISVLLLQLQKMCLLRTITNKALLIFTLLMSYELFLDVFLFHSTIKGAFNNLYSRFMLEAVEAERALIRHPSLSTFDLVRYLVATQSKVVFVWVIAFIQLMIVFIMFLKFSREDEILRLKKLTILQLISMSLYVVTYPGVASFEGSKRLLFLLQIFLVANIIYTILLIKKNKCAYNGDENSFKRFLITMLMVPVIIVNFIASFNLYPIGPTLYYNKESYKVEYSDAVSVHRYAAIMFVQNYASQNIYFVTLSSYITFGYSDLLWNVNKIPKHDFIDAGPMPDDTVNTVTSLIMNQHNIIIPMISSPRLLGRPGLKSYYLKPLNVLSTMTSMIYNNKHFSLFIDA